MILAVIAFLLDLCGPAYSAPPLVQPPCGYHAPINAPPNECEIGCGGIRKRDEDCREFPAQASTEETAFDMCSCVSLGIPTSSVVHLIRVARNKVSGPLAELQTFLTQPVSGMLPVATILLRESRGPDGSPDVGQRGDIPCCVRFDLNNEDLDDDGDLDGAVVVSDPPTYDEVALTQACRDLIDVAFPMGFRWLEAIVTKEERAATSCIMRMLGITIYIVDLEDYPDDVLGVASSLTGTIVMDEEATARVWLHELGHLFGLGHYDLKEDYKDRIMYGTADTSEGNESGGQVSCRDCNRFRLLFSHHPTIESSETGETCDAVISNEILPDGGVAGSRAYLDAGGGKATKSSGPCSVTSAHGTGDIPLPVLVSAIFGFFVRPKTRRLIRGLSTYLAVVLVLGCSPREWIDSANNLDGGLLGDFRVRVSVSCEDDDEDGYGQGCSKGVDCDDQDYDSHPGAFERCDNRDNDCDGIIDEGTGAGEQCNAGVEGCPLPGAWMCRRDGTLACLANVSTQDEACDGIDNDCNGLVDDGNPGGGVACDTNLAGICSAGHTVCHDGELECEQDQQAGTEVCNLRNDDCDEVESVDEDLQGMTLNRSCYAGPEETEGVGRCHSGLQTCGEGVWRGCVGQVLPTAETCDTYDNDCDGVSDGSPGENGEPVYLDCFCLGSTDFDCYSGPPSTRGVGACHDGTHECTMGGTQWGPCMDEALPNEESCNGVDDDCDGTADENLVLGDDVVTLGAACAMGIGGCRAQGVYECGPGGEVHCTAIPSVPVPESCEAGYDTCCDGIDNNCNGLVDESPPDGFCVVGVGACAKSGVLVCDELHLPLDPPLKCSVESGNPTVEICNGVDDDCNGVTDDVSVEDEIRIRGTTCILGLGACQDDGLWECTDDGAIYCDARPRDPGPEVCDGIDNDCDGSIDDGFGLGNVCAGIGVCGSGVYECSPAHEVVCSTLPGGSAFEEDGHFEMLHCDGLDNDCNGETDEYFWDLGQPCSLSCVNVYVEGAYVCRGDHFGTVCSVWFGGPKYPIELCDGIDNNCNGQTDEGFGVGTPCGVGACAGVLVCGEPNSTVCNGTAPVSESCNSVDDDCDDQIDEGNPGGGVACDGTDTDLCNEGVTSCVGGSLACTDATGNNVELCNGEDDDCDEATADGSGELGVGAACDGNDADQCNEGVTSCLGGGLVCGDATGDSVDVCNGLDDDCDNVIDDGFNVGGVCDGKGECGAGTRECDGAGGVRCSTDVGGSEDEHVAESPGSPYFNCSDGLDNDCDSLIDTGPGGDPDCN